MDKRVYLTILLTNFILLLVIAFTFRDSDAKKISDACNTPPDYSSYSPMRSYCLEDILNLYLTEYYIHGETMNASNRAKVATYLGLKESDRFKIASHNLVIYENLSRTEGRPIDGTLNLEKFFLSLKINVRKQLGKGEFKVDSVLFYGMDRKMEVYFSLVGRAN